MSPDLSSLIPTLVWAATWASAALAVCLGAVIAYHLHHYAMNQGAMLMVGMYSIVSALLVIALIGAASFV